jgi:predicted membrane chloride channel (bestrophin family)
MARTILFLYVYTIPFVLLNDESSLLVHCVMVIVFTYGFIGLELIAIELDNPFGADANDFDHNALAMTMFENVYLFIHDVDGPEWTDKLRLRLSDPSHPLPYPSEQCWMSESQEIE